MTWFRGETSLEWIPVKVPLDPRDVAEKILARLKA
jgi:hypothetical protein